MSAAHVRRGASARARPRKGAKVAVPKKIAKRLPVDQARANKVAGIVFGGFMLAIALVVLVALDIPAKAERAAGSAVGRAGFTVSGYQIVGLAHMDRRLVDAVVNDIVERKPAALWQSKGQLALIDAEGVVLDRVPVNQMPDLPLVIGPGANMQEDELERMMADVPTLKPQLASATWVGGRRWDLNFQSGETVALPEGYQAARTALAKFARADRQSGLLGRGMVRFDLRVPGKMIVRLPHALEPAASPKPQEG